MKKVNIDEIIASVDSIPPAESKPQVKQRRDSTPNERIRLAKAVQDIRAILFSYKKENLADVFGREQLSRMITFLQEASRRIRDNGWKYHIPQPYQEEFHRSYKRHRCVFGGNRSGKTIGGVWEASCFAMGEHPYKKDLFIPRNAKIMVAGQSMKTVRETINPYLFSFLPKRSIADIRYLRNEVIDFIEMEGGRRIIFGSYDQGRKRFQGFSCYAYHMDEEPPEDIYQECMMRLLDTKGFLWMTLTPLTGLTWVYHDLYANPVDDPEHEIFFWATEDNATLDQEEVERVFSRLPEDVRKARAHGEFIGASGIIYPWLQSDAAYCEPFPIPEKWQLIRVIDPSAAGITACLWIAIDPYSNLWAYREYYAKGRTISEHCQHIRHLSGNETYIYDLIDGQSLATTSGENLETQFDQYSRHLYDSAFRNALVPFTDKNIENGIYTTWEYHHSAELYAAEQRTEDPFFRPFNTLVNLRSEGRKYRWQENLSGPNKGARTGKPIHRHCHLMDCMRYACHYRPRYQYPGLPIRSGRPWKDPVTGY